MSAVFSKVMLTLDGSDFARQAAPQAVALAQKFESELILYTVLDYPHHAMSLPLLESDIDELESGVDRRLHAAAERTKAELESQVAELGVDPAQVEIVIEAYGNPAEAIVHYADENDVDLIVMCTHGRGGLDRRLHGSVAESVLRHTPCPIMLIRALEKK